MSSATTRGVSGSARPEVSRILAAIEAVLPEERPVTLHEPRFAGREWEYVKTCLDTGWVSSAGKFVDEFERRLAEFTGIPHAVATVNGTAALQVSLRLAGVRADDEVLVPALTFVATAAAVKYLGAEPHFVDCETATLGMDPEALEDHLEATCDTGGGECVNRVTGRRIRAVVPMHTFGHPVRMAELMDLARRFDLEVVEDAAESLGSTRDGVHTGSWGRIAAMSFNGNKTITTGGGGAILTADPEIAERARHLTTTAKLPHRWEYRHDEVGYNFRLPNINAALGCAQMEALPELLRWKRALAEAYRRELESAPGVEFVVEPESCRSNYWLNAVLLPEEGDLRAELLEATNDAGILTRPAWTPLHELAPYRACPRAPLPVTESLARRLVNLPSSAHLGARLEQT